ncbi:DNA polymerase III subunit chi [Dongshaea marina]|uniref:DNA polymerase III subunit chi n=1 Tax=Dongshaea marina TaxID=2047966 RepID=UPI000D3E4A53|nr:DNA polymerase III subunit chi [Dongshaea marina]
MKKASFHVLSDSSEPGAIPAHYALACTLANQFYQQGKWLYLLCDDRATAEQIDEALWQLDPDLFVPHQLQDEVPGQKAPVEIIWDAPKQSRSVLINLAREVPSFAARFEHVIDFVPADEDLKQLARERYKSYRQLGMQLDVIQPGQ